MIEIDVEELVGLLNEAGVITTVEGNCAGLKAARFSSLNSPSGDSICWTGKVLSAGNVPQCLVLICPPGQPVSDGIVFIFSDSPRRAFAEAVAHFHPEPRPAGVSACSSIHPTVKLGADVCIGDGCVIGEGCRIGDKTVIDANVTIYHGVNIGANCHISSGTVIGADGFGYILDDKKLYKKMRHIGGVFISDNVEIGANACIDRGVLDDTFIGDNTKIDNLVQIAHNVRVGRNCVITAMTTICGSAAIGDNCWLSPGSVVPNKVTLADETQIGINSVPYQSVGRSNLSLVGDPARPMLEYHIAKK